MSDWRFWIIPAALLAAFAFVAFLSCKKTCCGQKWGPFAYAEHVRSQHVPE